MSKVKKIRKEVRDKINNIIKKDADVKSTYKIILRLCD